MYLLDTNVVSELRKCSTGKGNASVGNWARTVTPNELYLSAITILEIEMGILLKQRKDPKQGAILRQWLNQKMLPAFEGRILPLDTTIALACAQLHIPDPKSERDAMIAATAITHQLTVVTRNIDDFKHTGVKLLNPWEGV
ncbi:type II toxin-antitoxin system VapC family toxin [Endozoicomonas sp. GU-1]|uniref:type II toxin-antitoxin system VapC family toxin n=1 Tax=Endozoicomonas sp. GU-1 TaxID=3009078 RepID=UPI0022B4D3A0|nr:type II toxin-antitoxin system VapC family toxin [Endozoicomonas sp. GU-1]WBA81518.1 type II toxin-antitoxin system VapC family toxin [Endozoicomonas sp. GU-1]WBA84467.1 type II toxin-antitoxin system VapC family toxin [Endozoicomonas sp. GU-1]